MKLHKKLSNVVKSAATILISILIIFAIVEASTVKITPPAGEPTATFYSMSEIYNFITANTAATVGSPALDWSAGLEDTGRTLTDIYNALAGLISADKVKLDTTYLNVAGELTPANGAVSSLTAANAACGQTYFGSSASSWTPSSGTLCAGRCQACNNGVCGNATSGTDINSECGSNCCSYCDGSGECAYRVAGATCTSPGTTCNGSYKCDGAGGCGLWACGDPIEYEGESYTTVYIGTQCWFAENLNIGTRIAGAGNQTSNGTIEKYCYSDQETYCDTEGGLYQWGEAMAYSTTPGAQGLCPSGWHIPTHNEYTALELAVCTSASCATDFPYDALTTGWRGTNEGTKLKSGGTSGFTGLLVGSRSTDGTFSTHGTGGGF